ncbi:MAG: PAS domain-containing protein [Chloroflexi bacterium]|nr:PAS domain-containing protein [Chloroflexota bacterium]
MQAAANGVLITNTNGITEWANPALSQMSGYTIEELIGQSGGLFDADLYDPDRYQEMWRKLSAGQSWEGEIVNQRKNRSRYTELQTIAPVRNSQNVVTHYVAIKQDISQRKAVEARLEKQNQELLILGKLGQTVVSSLELNIVFDQVIQQLMPLFQAECISIILREETRLVYVATGGLHAGETRGKHIALDFGVPGLVLDSKEPICIVDNEDMFPDACGCDPQSTIAAPCAWAMRFLALFRPLTVSHMPLTRKVCKCCNRRPIGRLLPSAMRDNCKKPGCACARQRPFRRSTNR